MSPAAAGLVDGVALAALMGGDADEARRALDGALATATDARLAELRALPREARAAARARLSRRVRGAPSSGAILTARARAVLAAEVPREVGAAWLAAAPPVRRGFRADDGLRHTLRALAVAPAEDDAETARRETGHGRATVAAARETLGPHDQARLLDAMGPAEAAAILALADLSRPTTPTLPAALAASIVHEAVVLARGAEISRVIGALALGAAGELAGDARSSRWRVTGHEIARLHALAAAEDG